MKLAVLLDAPIGLDPITNPCEIIGMLIGSAVYPVTPGLSRSQTSIGSFDNQFFLSLKNAMN